MISLPYVVVYVAFGIFIIAVIARFFKLSKMPIHLRWELYPVAHERGKATYGGSYLEEPEWWKKPRQSSLIGELKVMVPEILLLSGVWKHNQPQWWRSFPFHFGLYMMVGAVVLLLAGGIAQAAGAQISAAAGGMGVLVYHLTYFIGWFGLILGLLGSVALLGRRLFNPDYRVYTKGIDYFNLFLFVVTFAVAIGVHASVDPYFIELRAYFQQLVTFDIFPQAGVSELMTLEIVLASVLVAYIPLTHMSHFFTKWFMYHDIRWNDEPNLRGGKIEKRIEESLTYPVSWAAPHIRGDGKKNWVDVATSSVEEEKD